MEFIMSDINKSLLTIVSLSVLLNGCSNMSEETSNALLMGTLIASENHKKTNRPSQTYSVNNKPEVTSNALGSLLSAFGSKKQDNNSLFIATLFGGSKKEKINSISMPSQTVDSNNKMSDGKRTELEGAAMGTLLGALAGRVACNKKNRAGCMAISAGIGAIAGAAYGRKIAKQKKKYVKIEDFYGNTISSISNDNKKLVAENKHLKQNIVSLKNKIRVAKASSLSSSRKRQELAKIKKSLVMKISQNKNLVKKYNGNLAYSNAVLEDLQKEVSQKKQMERQMTGKRKSASKIASQHANLKGEIIQLKTNIKKLEDQNEQLAALDPSII